MRHLPNGRQQQRELDRRPHQELVENFDFYMCDIGGPRVGRLDVLQICPLGEGRWWER